MKAWSCAQFELELPPGHRFPMSKYRLLQQRVQQCGPSLGVTLHVPPAATDADLLRVHAPGYVQRMCRGTGVETDMRRIGFPWSAQMIERSRRSSGASMQALRCAIEGDGISVNLAGGTHHAGFDRGGGYCVFNDSVVAARHVQAEDLAQRVLVIDLDVHQGDGTAALCAVDDSIYTFLMHAARNYPAVKPPSDLDVALPDGCDDTRYLEALATQLLQAIRQSRADAAIYIAGADPFVGDRLGHLALTKEGLAQRDRHVVERCRRAGLPLAVSMGGGYAEAVEDIVDIHFSTVRIAAGSA